MISIPVLKKNIMESIGLWGTVTGFLLLMLLFLFATYQPDGKAWFLQTVAGAALLDFVCADKTKKNFLYTGLFSYSKPACYVSGSGCSGDGFRADSVSAVF